MLGALKMQGKEIARKPELYRDRGKTLCGEFSKTEFGF